MRPELGPVYDLPGMQGQTPASHQHSLVMDCCTDTCQSSWCCSSTGRLGWVDEWGARQKTAPDQIHWACICCTTVLGAHTAQLRVDPVIIELQRALAASLLVRPHLVQAIAGSMSQGLQACLWRWAAPLSSLQPLQTALASMSTAASMLHMPTDLTEQDSKSSPTTSLQLPRCGMLLSKRHGLGFQGLGRPGLRSLNTTSSPVKSSLFTDPVTGSTPAVYTAAEVLQQTMVVKLRGALDLEAEKSLYIPYTTFVEMAKAAGAASDDEAAELCKTLHKAGIVLEHQDVVYLRAEEVAEMVMLMLPGGKEDAQRKLEKVEAELAELDKIHQQVERTSSRWADALLGAGLVVLSTQFVAFIYLTWWELSWDVMEPIAYIISLFYSLVAYFYFMATRHSFDLGPISEFWAKRFKDKKIQAIRFDAERYDYLCKLAARYKRHLAHTRI